MARIRCHYLDCAFLDDGYCSAAAIELDPDNGCLTYAPTSEVETDEEWDETEELEEWEDIEEEEEEEDLWDEDDNDY